MLRQSATGHDDWLEYDIVIRTGRLGGAGSIRARPDPLSEPDAFDYRPLESVGLLLTASALVALLALRGLLALAGDLLWLLGRG